MAAPVELPIRDGGRPRVPAYAWFIVPELASRRHIEVIVPVIRRALATAGSGLRDLDGIAVTQGPGLVGSLSAKRGTQRLIPPAPLLRKRGDSTKLTSFCLGKRFSKRLWATTLVKSEQARQLLGASRLF